MAQFTDRYILNLKPAGKMFDVRERDGFGIRVLPSGVKTWFFIYRFDGKRRFLNLGHYPALSLGEARIKYRDALKLVEKGKDPLSLSIEAKYERRKAPTVAELTTEYIERHAKRFKRSWQEDERILNLDVVPTWGKRKAADILKRDVVKLLETIIDRGAPSSANNCFQVVRKMFNWAVEKDILTTTPCLGVKLPAPKLARERTLSEDEIKTLWASLDRTDLTFSDGCRRALKLVLVTAQRPGEVAGMHTSEIDGRWWTIPAERAKNGKTHRVYLTDTAIELIGDMETLNEKTGEHEARGFLFPSPRRKSSVVPVLDKGGKPVLDNDGKPVTEKILEPQPIDPHALPVAVTRNLAVPVLDKKGRPLLGEGGKPKTENMLGIDHFTPHDLRRTAATFMAKMGTMDEVIDAILNHSKQGVIKVYNQYRYDTEKQAAMEAWERKLQSLTTGKAGKVIPLQKKII